MAMKETMGLGQSIKLNLHEQELSKLQTEYSVYTTNFKQISNLKEGDKLARDNSGVYYIHTSQAYFVQLRRWWSNQGRAYTFIHLDEDFTKFMKYLDTVLNMLSISFDTRCRKLANNLKDLANSLMAGLYTLKKTYPDEKKLVCKIDSIILSLIDFKEKVGEKLAITIPFTQQRQRAFSD